jgi:hypothetical protein
VLSKTTCFNLPVTVKLKIYGSLCLRIREKNENYQQGLFLNEQQAIKNDYHPLRTLHGQ